MSARQEVSIRREVVRMLFTMGLSHRDIAIALNVDLGSVRNDYKHLGGKGAFPDSESKDSLERRNKAYSSAFLMYAQLINLSVRDINRDRVKTMLVQSLESYLSINDLRNVAEGIALIIQQFCNPADPVEYHGHRALLNAVFRDLNSEKLSGKKLLVLYLDQVILQKATTPGYGTAGEYLSVWAFEEYKHRFSIPLGESALRAIDAALNVLTSREREILHMRFGIGCAQLTLAKVGKHFGICSARVQQIEAKALRKLRHPSRIRQLEWLVSVQDAASTFLSDQFPLPLPPKPNVPDYLNRSIKELEISVRAYNCLEAAGIKTIGELVQNAEEEMYRLHNLGRKSLDELRAVLADMGLRFGMSFPQEG